MKGDFCELNGVVFTKTGAIGVIKRDRRNRFPKGHHVMTSRVDIHFPDRRIFVTDNGSVYIYKYEVNLKLGM